MKQNLLKYYLLHFIYLPIVLVYSVVTENWDFRVVGLVMTISIFLFTLNFFFNYGMTMLGLGVVKKEKLKFIPFILPTAAFLVLYYPILILINYLDFGGIELFWLLVLGSSVINALVFLIFNRKHQTSVKNYKFKS